MHQCALKLQNYDIDSRARERPSCPMPFAVGTDKTALAKRRGTSDRVLTKKVNVQFSDDPEYAAYVLNATRTRFVTGAQGPAAECGLKRGPNRAAPYRLGGPATTDCTHICAICRWAHCRPHHGDRPTAPARKQATRGTVRAPIASTIAG